MRSGDRTDRVAALRRRMLLGAWLLAGLVILGKSVRVQVVQGSHWSREAAGQQRASTPIPAARGAVYDRHGVPLAVSRERWAVSVAPRELTDAEAVRAALVEVLGVSPAVAGRATTDVSDPWHPLPGRYPADVRAALDTLAGVYLERHLERYYPHDDLARSLLGSVIDDQGQGGVEEMFDDVLRGVPGSQVVGKGVDGEIPGEVFEVERPVPGGEVRLTIDLDLQEIAETSLREALEGSGARGGDLIVADPRTGEILAMTSVHEGSTQALSTINAPYEPGSTVKPFIVAGLLETGKASLDDSVDTGVGYWRVAGRDLRDVGPARGVITLAEALRVSSNVGVAKAAQALTAEEQYATLRDFGFGLWTGLGLPGENPGHLRTPDRWSAQSPVSLAIGYEMGVTPLQMTMAYGALANGGVLFEPRLVREVRTPRGEVESRGRPRKVRRVVPEGVAAALAGVLVDVVEGGTGTAARMATFRVAGKSGTSRVYETGVGYVDDRYFASFVGFFPASDPQLVIYVKMDVEGQYGGAAAAPVTRSTLEAILAARKSPIDRGALMKVARPAAAVVAPRPDVRFVYRSVQAEVEVETEPRADRLRPDTPVPVPDVEGLPLRVAARRLHALGFRVARDGTGMVLGTSPPAGARVVPGDTVRLRSARARR